MTITRRKKRKDSEDKLIITVQDWGTQAVGCLPPEEVIAFLWWWLPKLAIRMIDKIDDEDGWAFMKRLICKAIIHELEEYLDDMDSDDDEEEDLDDDEDDD